MPTTRYTDVLLSLLPPGVALSTDTDTELYALADAIGVEFNRVDAAAAELIEEADPRTTNNLLPDYERVYGLPGDNPNPPTTIDGRRAALLEAIRGLGDASKENVEALLAALASGFFAWRDFESFDPFVAGSAVGAALYQDEWQNTVRLHLETYDSRGNVDLAAQWIITRLTQAHAVVLLQFIGFDWFGVASANQLYGVATDGTGLWLAVGINGTGIRYVVDGGNTSLSLPSSLDYYACCVVNGRWWIFGAEPGPPPPPIRYSTDTALTFTGSLTAAGSYTGDLLCCATDGVTLIVAAGTGAGIQRIDNNGASHTAPTAAASYSGDFNAAAYAASLFVLVGTSNEIQTSPDGTTWTHREAVPTGTYFGDLNCVAYGNGLWVAGGDTGEIQTSPDGVNWTRRTPGVLVPYNVDSVAYAGNHWYVATSDGTMWRTADPTNGSSWTVIPTIALGNRARALVWGGRYLARGTNGFYLS